MSIRGEQMGVLRFSLRMVEAGGVTELAPLRYDAADVIVDSMPATADESLLGRPRLPGTSITGALRERISQELGEHTASAWLGPRPKDLSGQEPEVSRLYVMDSAGHHAGDPACERELQREQFTQTAIDRGSGAARLRTRRCVEMLEPGAVFDVRLLFDEGTVGELADLAGVLVDWRPTIGRAVSTGHGRCIVDDVRHGIADFRDPEILMAWLSSCVHDFVDAWATDTSHALIEAADDKQGLLWSARLVIAGGPLLVAGTATTDENGRQVTRSLRRGSGYLIPGSSLKGVLRSRMEFIGRSVVRRGCGHPLDACLDQRCAHCFPCRVFGHGGGAPKGRGVGMRSPVHVADALLEDAREGAIHVRHTTHVAIDRFTGGSAQQTTRQEWVRPKGGVGGMLRTVEAPDRGAFTVSLNASALHPAERELASALLRLALNDLRAGFIGIGASTTRGYGTVSVPTDGIVGLPTVADARVILQRAVDDADALTAEAGAL